MPSIINQLTSVLFGKNKTRRHRKRAPRMAMAPAMPMPMRMAPAMRMPSSSGIAIIRVMSRRNTSGQKATRKQRRN